MKPLALLLVLGLAFRALRRRVRAVDRLGLGRPVVAGGTIQHVGESGATGPPVLDPPFSPAFARALALGLIGSLAVFSIHNLFDNLLVHGVGIQLGVLLGLIGGVSDR